MILEITTPFQCFGELLVMALEIGHELTIHFHHIEMNHFHHEFHLLLAQIWVVGFILELDCCQLLLFVAARHYRSLLLRGRCGTAADAASAGFGAAVT